MEAIRVPWRVVVDLFKGGVSKRFAFFAIAIGLLLLAAIWWVFDVLPGLAVGGGELRENAQLQRENDVRTTGLQALAGAVLAMGAAFTAYSVLSTREGQLDERFARALELMANEDSHVISGAIFSLERIALQSRFDRPAVVDVLSSFVRSGAPPSLGSKKPPGEVLDALRVLVRINELWRSPNPDLRETCWEKGQLSLLDLSGALLADSNLEEAVLFETKLKRANLFNANLARAVLFHTDFSKASLRGADLSGASLVGANLTGADLSRANLTGATLANTKLKGASLTGANLADVNLDFLDLPRAASLHEARYTSTTTFPAGFDPGEHGMVLDAGD